jgi:polyketide synthase 12/epothilone polyketide synthase D
VTQGAQAVVELEKVSVSSSSLWGLGRVVMQEHPELACRLVDLERGTDVIEPLWRELLQDDDETQVAVRSGKRHVARLVKAPALASLALPSTTSYRLEIGTKGVLDQLRLTPTERRHPGVGEVEIEIAATGLNFRDVLNALGMYPGEAGPLGLECAGVVTSVGADVEHVGAGDRVMAIAPGSFGRYVTVDARMVCLVPEGLTDAQAAAVPVVYLTACYGLHDLAQLQRGEKVLIHAATGGVGMAAVQIAQWLGAEVFGTASQGKREQLRSMGVAHISDSRTLVFAEEFGSVAGKVDVVLNSLAREFVDASLGLLTRGGRFVEIGKTDIRSASSVASSHPGVNYWAFDLLDAGPQRIQEMFAQVAEGFRTGHLWPLPVKTFPLERAEQAFRYMAQARHVGKVVLTPVATGMAVVQPSSTVLITGGLGALGLLVAEWLALEQGVKHLVLAGRSAPSAEKLERIEQLRSQGTQVTVSQLDIADAAQLHQLLTTLPSEYPLRGVVHAAGVLADAVLSQQDGERFRRVFEPKVQGAWNLHEQTQGLSLDFFVLFSSVTSLLGNGGQGNYAAANAFLDGLAHYRAASGKPAQSLNWGAWSAGGMAATLDDASRARQARSGMGMLSPEQGVQLLAQALLRNEAQLGLLPLDVRALRRSLDGNKVPPVWRALVTQKAGQQKTSSASWVEQLAQLTAPEQLVETQKVILGEVAKVLSLASVNEVPLDRPLKDLGLDSLMAVELRNRLAKLVGKSLPATLVFDYPTVNALAARMLELLFPSEPESPIPSIVRNEANSDELAALDNATEDETLEMLMQKVASLKEYTK